MKFNRFYDDNFNIIGSKLKVFREKAKISQDTLSNKLALLDIKAEDLFQPNTENEDK